VSLRHLLAGLLVLPALAAAHSAGPTVVIVSATGGVRVDVELARAELVGRVPGLAVPDPAVLESWSLVRAAARDAVAQRVALEADGRACAARWRGPEAAGPDRLRFAADMDCGEGRLPLRLRLAAGDTAEQRTIVRSRGFPADGPPRVLIGAALVELGAAGSVGGWSVIAPLRTSPDLALVAAALGVAAATPAAALAAALPAGLAYAAGLLLRGLGAVAAPPGWLAAALLLLALAPFAMSGASAVALVLRASLAVVLVGFAALAGDWLLAAALAAAALALRTSQAAGSWPTTAAVALLAGLAAPPITTAGALAATGTSATLVVLAIAAVSAGLSMRLAFLPWPMLLFLAAAVRLVVAAS
jgi:hypothetical protein